MMRLLLFIATVMLAACASKKEVTTLEVRNDTVTYVKETVTYVKDTFVFNLPADSIRVVATDSSYLGSVSILGDLTNRKKILSLHHAT